MCVYTYICKTTFQKGLKVKYFYNFNIYICFEAKYPTDIFPIPLTLTDAPKAEPCCRQKVVRASDTLRIVLRVALLLVTCRK